jgi:photosystem II stability/assembly factor-like uncharacterized protein
MTRPLSRLLPTLCLLVVAIGQLSGQTVSPPGTAPQTGPLVTADLLRGLTFRQIGPPALAGPITDLAVVESAPATFYVASASGGVWKTTNGGTAFEPLFDGERVHAIGAVAVFQPNPEIVWVGTGETSNEQDSSWGDGVYKSTDGGRTWDHLGLRDSRHIARIALHPTNPEIVFVAALGHLWGPNRERGLFKSVDGGKTWRNVLFVDNDTGVADVAIDPSDPKVMYAAAYQRRRRAWGFHGGGPGSGLYKSIDAGDSWTKLTDGLPTSDKGRIGIAIAPTDPRIVYASIEQGVRYDTLGAYEERKAGVYRSEDKGATWTLMSDWNPRPMSASRIRVDPTDESRVYMAGAFSYSTDRGKTFTSPPEPGGGDRVLWIDPRDSTHLLGGGDRGVSVSRDRGATWRDLAGPPVSRVNRVSVDMRKPFRVHAGFDDHGSWSGPSTPPDAPTPADEAWTRTSEGDVVAALIDPRDNRTLYLAAPFLGLSRVDTATQERAGIRPADARGAVATRRDWKTWGHNDGLVRKPGMAPSAANYDAPLFMSPYDSKVLYAGSNELWRSIDRGQTWVTLGDRTTAVDRLTLRVMTQLPSESTLSLDDGVPFYPTMTAIAESPLRRRVLWVGTADGNLQISRDGGRTWLTIANRLPNLPKASYVSSIELSRHAENTVYVAFDNHRSDDNGNYLYRTTDGGATWTAIDSDLPLDRVIRVVREDPKNPNVLYLGTEMGLYVSVDQGQHWVELGSNLPPASISDLVVHPRDNDLVVATRGRGIWILDNVTAIQALAPQVLGEDSYLFPVETADTIGRDPRVIVDYYLKSTVAKPVVTIHDAAGATVATFQGGARPGVNRLVWNLQPSTPAGAYTVRLTVGGRTLEHGVEVRETPRLETAPSDPAMARLLTGR